MRSNYKFLGFINFIAQDGSCCQLPLGAPGKIKGSRLVVKDKSTLSFILIIDNKVICHKYTPQIGAKLRRPAFNRKLKVKNRHVNKAVNDPISLKEIELGIVNIAFSLSSILFVMGIKKTNTTPMVETVDENIINNVIASMLENNKQLINSIATAISEENKEALARAFSILLINCFLIINITSNIRR